MSRSPRVIGTELVAALAKSGFGVVRIRGSHNSLRHADGRGTVVPSLNSWDEGTLEGAVGAIAFGQQHPQEHVTARLLDGPGSAMQTVHQYVAPAELEIRAPARTRCPRSEASDMRLPSYQIVTRLVRSGAPH